MLKNFTDVISRILAIRDSKGLTTIEFARQLKMTPQTVDLYLKGERKPSLEFVFNVCSTFGESADKLLGLAEVRERLRPAVGVKKFMPVESDILAELAALKNRVSSLERNSAPAFACG